MAPQSDIRDTIPVKRKNTGVKNTNKKSGEQEKQKAEKRKRKIFHN